MNWNLVDSNNDVNNLFSTFYNKLNKSVNRHTAFKTNAQAMDINGKKEIEYRYKL